MHDVLLTLEQDILSLNKASADLNDYKAYIDEMLDSVDISPTEINEAMLQEGGALHHVADDLKDLNKGISQYNRYLYRLEALLRENYTN
jgi:hypothetical protein